MSAKNKFKSFFYPVLFLALISFFFVFAKKQSAYTYSRLWGKSGELWNTAVLQDFSTAGYNMGNSSYEEGSTIVNVIDYGANGSDTTDDTQAFRDAIKNCPAHAVVFIPRGRYIIKDSLLIRKSNIEIKGQDETNTVLYFPFGLDEVHPRKVKAKSAVSANLIKTQKAKLKENNNVLNNQNGEGSADNYTTPWSYSGGFIWFQNCSNVALCNLTLSFPDIPYRGHFLERGCNGANFRLVTNGWAENITFYNCDCGIFADSSHYVTFKNFIFTQYKDRGQVGGHHGIDLIRSSYCLVENANFYNRWFHELGLEWGSNHDVYSSCKGINLHFDHHQINVHDNLWTDIDAGEGTEVWNNNANSLQKNLRFRSGSTLNDIYWNIKSKAPIKYPDPSLHNIVVGVNPDASTSGLLGQITDAWYEAIDTRRLYPQNLYIAQLEYRKSHTNK